MSLSGLHELDNPLEDYNRDFSFGKSQKLQESNLDVSRWVGVIADLGGAIVCQNSLHKTYTNVKWLVVLFKIVEIK